MQPDIRLSPGRHHSCRCTIFVELNEEGENAEKLLITIDFTDPKAPRVGRMSGEEAEAFIMQAATIAQRI